MESETRYQEFSFLRDESASPWLSDRELILPNQIPDYSAISDAKLRKQIVAAERQRYGKNYPYDLKKTKWKSGEECRKKLGIPSPVYHHHTGWWKQIPRLGIAYTVQDLVAQDTGVLDTQFERVADSMLFVMAVFASNRILARRLRQIFSNPYPEEAEAPDDDAENPSFKFFDRRSHMNYRPV